MKKHGYHGRLLNIDLSSRETSLRSPTAGDMDAYIGGRGMGMKILWDTLKRPGIDALSPEVPLMFLPGPFSGLPIPSASRTCIVTKSPCTSPIDSDYPSASTISYSNMGGFLGPEIRFAGYDGVVVTGKASSPVYVVIDDDNIEIRDAGKFWGMKTDAFDKKFLEELGDRRFRTCYIGPAGENLVSYACVLHTAARAAGRGVGCVMGAKNLKAIAVKGSKVPEIASSGELWNTIGAMRKSLDSMPFVRSLRTSGTADLLARASGWGVMAVKNYREGTFEKIAEIDAEAARKKIWLRDSACYCCPVACKKAGVVKTGSYAGVVHDSPEYETGTMLGANLMISNIEGVVRAIADSDDYGMDSISLGNVIGFLMEAYDRDYIDKAFLDGIDLKWGDVDATREMIERIAMREGIGDLASKGVKAIAETIGKSSASFAIHVKGQELAAWNVQANPGAGLGYATATRGACHLSGNDPASQNSKAMVDSLGLCSFVSNDHMAAMMSAITGSEWSKEDLLAAGERIYTLEKMFNHREGFARQDDNLPERFFTDPLTMGPAKGAVLKKDQFEQALDKYYSDRGWDAKTSSPSKAKLEQLGLGFTLA